MTQNARLGWVKIALALASDSENGWLVVRRVPGDDACGLDVVFGMAARIFAIAGGNDLDRICFDPAFNIACRRLPDLRTDIRLGQVLGDLWLSSYPVPTESVTFKIDDTVDVIQKTSEIR